MRFKIDRGLIGYTIKGEDQEFIYSYRLFTQSGILKNKTGEVVATLSRKFSWFGYIFELQTPNQNYTFIRKITKNSLLLGKPEKDTKITAQVEIDFDFSLILTGRSYEFETKNEEHYLASLVIACFYISLEGVT